MPRRRAGEGASGSSSSASAAAAPPPRPLDGFHFFGFALGHYYLFGSHRPGRTDLWKAFEKVKGSLPQDAARGIGTPAELRAHLARFEETGVDQVVFIQQGGRNRHEHICESLELFAREVLPEFRDRHQAAARRKQRELEPSVEAALARKQRMPPIAECDIPEIKAYGRNISEGSGAPPSGSGLSIPREDPAGR
jgi:hypothetical protein